MFDFNKIFNFSKKLAFGLDLSDASFKIVQLKKDKSSFYISSFIKSDIPKGIVEGGVIQKEKELVSIFEKSFKNPKGLPFQGKKVICSLPEEKVFVRTIQLPKMKEEELSEAVKWEAEAHIPLEVKDVYLSWEKISSDQKDNKSDILIAATPRNVVDKYLSFLEKVNLAPIAFEPESMSVVRSLIKKDDFNPTIIVDLGSTGTNFVIFSASALRFTSHVSISGSDLEKAIADKIKISLKKAKEFKIKFGLGRSEDDPGVFKAVEPIINNLVDQIKDYMIFYNDHFSDVSAEKSISQIILCGGDSHLLKLPETLSSKLKIPVKVGDPLLNFSFGKNSDKKAFSKKESLVYATAIGLSLRQII